MNFFLLIITIIAGIGVMIIVARRPNQTWPVLVAIAVFSGGLLIPGYPVINESIALSDEYLVFFLILGALFCIISKKIKLERESSSILQNIHNYLFAAFILYMALESARGYFIWNNPNALRWTGFYIMLGFLFLVMSYRPFSFFDRYKNLIVTISSALIYFICYLSHGIYSGIFRNINWSYLQGREWTGGAYANFPGILAIPAALIALRDKAINSRWRFLALLLLAICFFSGFYYESRISLLVFGIFFILFALKAGLKKIAPIILILMILLAAYFSLDGGIAKNIRNYSNVFIGTLEGKHDLDRLMHLEASINSVKKDWKTFLFGYGIYSHHFVMIPYLQEISDANLRNVKVEGPVITESFMAYLLDTGWIGIMLLFSNFLCAGIAIFSKKNSNTVFILAILFILFFWMFVTNLNDFILFYIMIMPNGLLFNLNNKEE